MIEERIILYSLIANLKEGVLILDKLSIPIIVNNNFVNMYQKISGRKIDLNSKLEANNENNTSIDRFLSDVQKNISSTEIIELKNEYFLLIGNSINVNKDSTPLGIMIEIHDITELKKVDMLEKNFRKLIMHELRTPTTSLHLAVSNLVKYWDKISNKDRDKLLDSLMTQSNRFADIIKKISTLSDLEDNRPLNIIDIDYETFFRGIYKRIFNRKRFT